MNVKAYRRVVDGMWADPDLRGDLLAVGVYWAGLLHLTEKPPDALSGRDTARAVFGDMGGYAIGLGAERHVYDRAVEQLLRVLRDDIRRYDPYADPSSRWGRRCEAPMIRREGLCGKDATTTHQDMVRDLETGERLFVARCSRHIQWAEAQARANRAAWNDLAAKPVPPANVGGMLRRHLPELDWPAYWRSLDARWVEPPERIPFVPPTLTIVINPDYEPDPAAPRAQLVLVGPEQ